MKQQTYQKIFELPELRNKELVFKDRTHAGYILASMLINYLDSNAIVMAIPSGGLPVAAEISKRLNLPLDTCVVSKITPSWNSEVGYGAVSFNGIIHLNQELISSFGLSKTEIDEGIEKTKSKVKNRLQRFRRSLPFPNLKSKTVILVDDGLASGLTMQVAIEALKKEGANQIIVAVPTAHYESVIHTSQSVSAIYCANIRSGLQYSVAAAYENWYDVAGYEAEQILHKLI